MRARLLSSTTLQASKTEKRMREGSQHGMVRNHTSKTEKRMREGRQHGMVRNYMVLPPPCYPRPKSKVVNGFTSPPTAYIYTKVPTKPTIHSKFTGCCRKSGCPGCHSRPPCKSKDKTKGTHKLKSYDVTLNHRLIEWRVVDKGLGLNFDEMDGQMDDDRS